MNAARIRIVTTANTELTSPSPTSARTEAALPTFPGSSPNRVTGIALPPLLNTGVVDTTAGPTSASATVSSLNLSISAIATLSAGVIESSCSYDPSTGTVGILLTQVTMTSPEQTGVAQDFWSGAYAAVAP